MFDFMYFHLSQMKTTDHNNETVTNTLDTKYNLKMDKKN